MNAQSMQTAPRAPRAATRRLIAPLLIGVIVLAGGIGTWLCHGMYANGGRLDAEQSILSRLEDLARLDRELSRLVPREILGVADGSVRLRVDELAARRAASLEALEEEFEARAREFVPGGNASSEAALREAAEELDSYERRAIEQARLGEFDAARALLFSPEYDRTRARFAESLAARQGSARGAIKELSEWLTVTAIQGLALLVTLLATPVVLWRIAIHNLRQVHAERDRVERTRLAGEKRFRDLIENVPAGIYRIGAGCGGRFLAANPAMTRMLGYDSVDDLLAADPAWHYADEAERREFSRRLREEGRVVGADLSLRRRDGEIIRGRISATVRRDENGRILYVDGIDEDITERKRAEEALVESERRYRLLAQNARDVIMTADMSLRLTYISPSILALRGYTAEETLAQRLDEIMPASSIAVVREALQLGLAEGSVPRDPALARPRDFEIELLCKEGPPVWVEVRTSFLRDENGRPAGVQGSLRDIGRRREAERAMRASEERYRRIVETANEGILILDANDDVQFHNGRLAELFALDRDENAITRAWADYAYDEEALRRIHDARAALREGRGTQFDLHLRALDGRDLWCVVSTSPMFDDAAAYVGSLVMLLDITERKRAEDALRESEARHRLLAENARDVIWTMDAELRDTYVSPSVTRLRGYTPEEVLAQTRAEAFHPESLAFVERLLAEEAALEKDPSADPYRSRTFEARLKRRDGSYVWTEIQFTILRDAEGRFAGVQGSTRDITERRRAEEALRDSERLYRGIIETAGEGIWIADANDRLTFANHRLAAMLGVPPERVFGRSALDFVHPDSRPVAAANEKLRRNGMRTHTDLRFLREDGTEFWAGAASSPMFDEAGAYLGSVTMISDITERKRAEDGNRILASVSALFLAGRKVGMAINAVLEMCGRFDGSDRAAVHRVGDDGETVSRAQEWCAEGVRREGEGMQKMPLELFRRLVDRLRGGQSVVIEDVEELTGGLRDRLKALDVRSFAAFPIFIGGGFAGFVTFESVRRRRAWSPSDLSVLRQTTDLVARAIERQSSEEALRASETLYTSLVEHLAQSVFRKGRDGRYTFANWSFCELVARPLEEILGRTDADVWPVDVAARFARDEARVLERGESLEKDEELPFVEGDSRFLHFVRTPVRDARGEIVGLQGIAWDVTERRRSEETVRAASRMEATATLAGGIAHDFNNLMVGILGNAELLQYDLGSNPQTARKLEIICSSARRGGELAQKLLAFARGGETRVSDVDLEPIVREALELQERAIPPGVRVECVIAPDLRQVRADPAQMTQVVMNLCINAIEAMGGEGLLSIHADNFEVDEAFARAHRGLKPGPHVRLVVRDTGSGMTPEVRARVFEPFFTTKFQGRGLGLAALYGVVRKHDGHVEVESEPGRGSSFRVLLPGVERPAFAPPVAEPSRPRGGAETILVVDDEPMILQVTNDILARLGYEVLAADTAEKAIRIASTHDGPIHLALLDLRLGPTDGRDVFPALRDARPAMKVIVCSGYDQDETARELLDAGADAYLTKPFRLETLAREVRSALDAGAAGREAARAESQ